MPKLFDRVKVNIATTGTGSVTFGPASSPAFLTPLDAGAQDGHEVRYTLVDGTDFEEGVGTIFSSVERMARTTVTRSKIGGNVDVNRINLSGTAVLVFTVSAADILNPENSLSDVKSASSARTNLGLGSAATAPASAFLQPGNNLGDVGNAGTARANLGLGSAAVLSNADVVRTEAAQALSVSQKAQARANIGVALKNRIINGAMMVSQENGTAAGSTTLYYAVDQFYVIGALSAGQKFSFFQVGSTTPAGSPNRIRVSITTASASVPSADYLAIVQNIEANVIADLALGSSSARTFVLKFGVNAPAGTYTVSFRNGANSRSYVAEYTISAPEALSEVYKTIVVPGDVITSGWSNTGAVLGLNVMWGLVVGSDYHQAAGSWHGANKFSSVNQANLAATNGNLFQLYDVGLYEGSIAPDFVVPDFSDELRRCQRYWCSTYNYGTQPGTATGAGQLVRYPDAISYFATFGTWNYPGGAMFKLPTITMFSPQSGASARIRNADLGTDLPAGATYSFTAVTPYVNNASVGTSQGLTVHVTANARI